jgi:hypothetical protein
VKPSSGQNESSDSIDTDKVRDDTRHLSSRDFIEVTSDTCKSNANSTSAQLDRTTTWGTYGVFKDAAIGCSGRIVEPIYLFFSNSRNVYETSHGVVHWIPNLRSVSTTLHYSTWVIAHRYHCPSNNVLHGTINSDK